ncbi:tryptophan synthase subunit alpha [Listeria floridensis FSL S10-1187]|uniref:tryptophan synthase n=1 Tax=Listeria floridensis FSL S10-1187 TaxID=1265817 RepID=A0ABP3B176_9LIST|nr:tryptophan synthase subunit alpha [Listeria floridensis FSL S10-1187]
MLIVPYIMAGDGGLSTLPDTIHFLEEQGVSAIEIGVPFSDPVADGPVIQEAGLRALNVGTTLRAIIEKLTTVETKVPLILMTYFNPVYQIGIEAFFYKPRKNWHQRTDHP